ncbi:MAG: helix-turn-helix domain-containing protein [Frankiales bacterium]|nr:helix-turn-helix domain-containing protein [Frankiales bacterium]
MTVDTHQASASPATAATTPCDLLDVDQAAERLGTPVRFVRRLIAERRIRFYKIGRYVRIDRHDLDRFVEDARIDPPESPPWAPAPR